jgi:orotidine-5'-phosphate decarboxylase
VPGQPLLYEHVARLAQGPWNLNGQLGLVVGATYPAEIERVRALAPTLPLLIPGVGAQGGDAVATVRAGWRADAPIVVNSSRAILLRVRRRTSPTPRGARRCARATCWKPRSPDRHFVSLQAPGCVRETEKVTFLNSVCLTDGA